MKFLTVSHYDLKGHIYHVIKELPYLLSSPAKDQIKQVIETTLPKQQVSCANLTVTLVKVCLKLLKCQNVDEKVKMLITTLVKITEVLYLRDSSRTPRSVLQLYNATWLHNELCCELIPEPREHTKTCFYGVYLHNLIVHSPQQYEIVCLRSTNAESQERLFSQAKHISLRATNRKPETVLPTILLSMQAREKVTATKQHLQKQESIVTTAASRLPRYKRTKVSREFIQQRQPSWQAHLYRISPYLVHGEGVWWKNEQDC